MTRVSLIAERFEEMRGEVEYQAQKKIDEQVIERLDDQVWLAVWGKVEDARDPVWYLLWSEVEEQITNPMKKRRNHNGR